MSNIKLNEVSRCSLCKEFYENTMKGLEEHWYGDNPISKYHRSITSNNIEMANWNNANFFVKIFKSPKISNSALEELLEYKRKLNIKMLKPITNSTNGENKNHE